MTVNHEFHTYKTIGLGLLISLCVLLTLVALSKPVAAQTNRQFSPGLLVFDAELGGPTQEQAVVLNRYTSFDNLIATSGGCPWATIPRGGITGKYLLVQVNPLRGTPGTNTCNILVTLNGASIGTLPVTLNLGNGGLVVESNGIAAPVTLTFTSSFRDSDNPPPQTVSVNSPGDFNVGVTYPGESVPLGDVQASFLTASPDIAGGKVIVSVNRTALIGNYKGLVYIETSAGTDVTRRGE